MRNALAAALLLALGAGGAFAQTPALLAPQAAPQPMPQPIPGGEPGGGPDAAGGGWSRRPVTPEMVAARKAMRQACAADVQKFCADAQTTGQRPMQCMRTHVSELSPGCAQAMQAMRAARQGGAGGALGAPQG